MDSLLDFTKPLDISLLDQAVAAFYDSGNQQVNKNLKKIIKNQIQFTNANMNVNVNMNVNMKSNFKQSIYFIFSTMQIQFKSVHCNEHKATYVDKCRQIKTKQHQTNKFRSFILIFIYLFVYLFVCI
jgi:hypothetical protein